MTTYSIEKTERAFFKMMPFPAVLYKVVMMMRNDKEPLYKLGQEIGKDPVLSARILEVANSPFYGIKSKVSDLPHAVSLLGHNNISAIVLRFVARKTYVATESANKSRLYPAKDIWLHSVKVAFISRALAKENNFPFPMECYTAGLLHDIGKNAIAVCIKKEDEDKILEEMTAGIPMIQAERDVIGFDHSQAGIHILKKLKISLGVLQAVKNHHKSMERDFREMSFILSVSNVLAGYDQTVFADSAELDRTLADRYGMSVDDFTTLDKIYSDLEIEIDNL